jgi:FtsP/CotA-like multicopper oxidase with cupredoxin domain
MAEDPNTSKEIAMRNVRIRAAAVVLTAVVALIGAACTSGGAKTGGGTASTTTVTMSEFRITPAVIGVPANAAFMLHVMNEGQVPHQFVVDVNGHTYHSTMLQAGDMQVLSFPALTAGTYSAWCSVPGHKESGMTALLSVGAAQAEAGGTGSTPMPGMDMSNMSPQQMADAHKASVAAFPAKTEGVGGQILEPTVANGVKVFDLIAKSVKWEVSPGVFQEAFTYNGTVPGPQIQVHRGDRIRIMLENELPQPTVMHFHGMTVPNAMDGVPYITQDPVMPGNYFRYEFTVKDPPGTYMYHSHFNSAEQVAKGLYGAIVVLPDHPTWDEDYTEILNDGSLGYTIDGKSFPATAPIVAHLGDVVHIRVANMGEMIHPLHLHGYHFTVLEQDGQALASPYVVDTLMVAPGQTYDLEVHATQPGVWAFHCHILSHVEGPQGMFGMVTALVVK